MSGRNRTRSTRHRWWRAIHRTAAFTALLFLVAEVAVVATSSLRPQKAQAAQAPEGQGFTVTPGDLAFILKQIKIAEHHAKALADAGSSNTNPCIGLVGPGPDQVPDRLTPYGLRTVDGSCNNLFPSSDQFKRREFWAASDQPFPRLAKPVFRDAEGVPAGFLGPGSPAVPSSSYTQKKGNVFDTQPRVISNLIVDQTSENPAAVAAAGHPVRSQDPTASSVPCDPNGEPGPSDLDGTPDGCIPKHKTLFIPNVTTDVGLSPPYNSVFTFFGQFFDHGVDQTVKSGGTVFVPLKADDPLRTLGPDGIAGNGDEVTDQNAFMVLTRAQNLPGPDGVSGDDPTTPADESADDIQDARNTDTPLVDQSQTYTSHASHQVFLREYVDDTNNHPVNTGKLLGDPTRTAGSATRPADANGDTGMSTWASVKKQAADLLGMRLENKDVLNVPMVAVDPYGNFIPAANGLPQYVTKHGLVPGDRANPVPVPADVLYFDTPFVGDIAHNADPSPQDLDHNPNTPPTDPTADTDTDISGPTDRQPAGTYDNELLDTHFTAGDGRVNENIALSAVHQIFHSEHDRLVDDIKRILTEDARPDADGGTASGRAALPEWQTTAANGGGADGWNGARLFQAARFVTEMEYQHLVFEDFARKIAPAIRPFHIYHSDGNPVIPAEFAHAVYRFGHSMLDDDVKRTNVSSTGAKSDNSLPLLTAFLNPPAYYNGGSAGALTPEQAAGSVFMGSADQTGNEIDEFVTETLRNNLLGLPLDLPTINMTRAREAGVPPLNVFRRTVFEQTHDSALKPYTSWSDFGQHLKHPESLINFVAAYGKHPSITSKDTYLEKRAAARAIVNPIAGDVPPDDAAAFLFGTGQWATPAAVGLDDVDLWVGGLAEVTNLFGGLLGSTFNYVFQTTLEGLQENDRFYYLNRTPGLNLRNQLEGNSFTELVLRNTQGTDSFKADAFGTADCKFVLSHLSSPAPAGSALTGPGSVGDDPASECNENALLLQKPDGTFQYRSRNTEDPPGINGQAVYQGADDVVDRVFGGNDNDTIWGAGGDDIIEGNGGDDVIFGGKGNDVITDLDGADVLEGGDDDDAIEAGPGDDLVLGGDGKDFTNAGINDNETFAGPGDDFVMAGAGADAVFGDGGSDWVEGGTGQDLLQGDHGAPFFDDPGEGNPGHEIMVGQDGENDYDVEGGDDLMSQNAHVDRNAGAGGFDWAFHQFDTVGADDDMAINNFLDTVPLPVVVNRDRWQETEADSGSRFNDIIKGVDDVPGAVGGGGFTGCDALDQAGIDRISGLNQLVTTLPTTLASVEALSATGKCPLQGPNVWAEGDILLGGGGGDTIEGRGANDIIDGDRALHVRLSVRTDPADPSTEVGTTDLMEGKPLNPDLTPKPDGNFGPETDGMTLQEAVFAGKVKPANIVMVREIVTEPATAGAIDTAVFSGPQTDYDISTANGVTTVVHARGAATDGTDTLRNIENLRFGGINGTDVAVGPAATLTPGAGVSPNFGNQQVNTTSAARSFVLTNTGLGTLTLPAAQADRFTVSDTANFGVVGTTCGPTVQPGGSCSVTVRFHPVDPAGPKSADLTATNNSGTQVVALTGNATAAPPPNRLATGTPTISDTTPQLGQVLTASTAGIGDPDGLRNPPGFTFEWQASALATGTAGFLPIGVTTPSFTVPSTGLAGQAARFLRYRVVVRFTDAAGHAETVTSAPTARPTVGANTTGLTAPVAGSTPAPRVTALGQALAPPQAPAPLRTASLSVSARLASPLRVTATVPAGANTVQISVFRLSAPAKRTSKNRRLRSTSVHVATVYRTTSKAKRYVFRLTEKPFRKLKPGRYLIQVRVGPSRTALGPASSRQITIRSKRSTNAR